MKKITPEEIDAVDSQKKTALIILGALMFTMAFVVIAISSVIALVMLFLG